MFGYIKPHDPYLYKKDDVLYRALYCGICKSIGATCGQTARMSLTYDIAFLSAFAHNLMGCDVKIKKSHCVIHPITKRPIATPDELSKTLAAVNVILCKYKVNDDRFDSGKGFFKSLMFKRGYKKAKKICPETDDVVSRRYQELRELESSDNGLIDAVSDKFAVMLAEISDSVFKDYKTENTYKLFYYIGKWIYIIDAIDDYDKDLKRGEYNPFVLRYGAKSRIEMLKENSGDIDFMFSEIFSALKDNFYKIKFAFNKDLLENIILRGIPMRTKAVFEGKKS